MSKMTLSDKQLSANEAQARENLVFARTQLVMAHPFFGQLALRMPLVCRRGKCTTAATDGYNLFFNPEFVLSLRKKEVLFLVVHEILHCVFKHMLRRGGRDPELFNIAADYVINGIIDNELVKKLNVLDSSEKNKVYCEVITTVQIYLDHQFDGMSTEEVYNILKKKADANGNLSNKGKLLDWHIDMNGDGQFDPAGSDDDQNVTVTSEQREELDAELQSAVISASQSAGNIPGDIKRMIGELLEPKTDWREVLADNIAATMISDYSWMRINKYTADCDVIFPGYAPGETIEVDIAIDTSGSMSTKMLQEMLSEVKGMMDQYDDYVIRVWQFDTKVYGYMEFTQENGDEIENYEIVGGGGTCFDANWKFMKEKDIVPTQFVVFTDGEPNGSWGEPEYCPTVFLIHTEYGKKVAPFGTTLYYERGA